MELTIGMLLGLMLSSLIYWLIKPKKPHISGILHIDNTDDLRPDVYIQFEDDLENIKNIATFKVSRK